MDIRKLTALVLEEVAARLEPLKNRVRLTLGKGVLHLVNDAGPCQTVQATYLVGETRDGMERPQDYGFTSHPLPGMQPFAGFFGGDRSNGFVIAMCDRQYRIELRQGEVAIYDDLSQRVHLTRDGIVAETPLNATVKAGKKLRLEAEDIEIHATRSLSTDVHGYGEKLEWVEGTTWRKTTWQQGATMLPDPVLPVHPPEGP